MLKRILSIILIVVLVSSFGIGEAVAADNLLTVAQAEAIASSVARDIWPDAVGVRHNSWIDQAAAHGGVYYRTSPYSLSFTVVPLFLKQGDFHSFEGVDQNGRLVGTLRVERNTGQVYRPMGLGMNWEVVRAGTVTPITVTLDGHSLNFDVPPQLTDGRTLVPLRAIFEALGAEVQWNAATQTATAMRGDTAVVLTIGSQTATINGQSVTMDVPGRVVDGRTLVPLRFVAEAFGVEVNWDSGNRAVTITSQ